MKDNKIIAEFMWEHSIVLDISDTKYHKSWDWLMPVIKKINEQMSPNVSGLWRMITHPYEYHIEDVFSQVVEFIKDRG